MTASGVRRLALRQLRPTSLFCVPTHLHRLLALPDLRGDDLASLRLLAHAGAPCPVALEERLLELAPEGSVWEFYGPTEGQFTVCSPSTWQRSPGTVGVARPGREVSIRDADPDTGVGTIWVTAPWHAGWECWRDVDATAAAWDGERFTVGDVGHLDGAVSFGVADDEWGERLVVAVIAWPGSNLEPEALRSSLRERLAPPKLPRQILVVDELPRTPTGKVRRLGLGRALGF